MQEKHLFEYAVLRLVPRVEREEFLNIGIILYCRPQKFLGTVFILDEKRIDAAFPGILDTEVLRCYLDALEQVCKGSETAGPIGKLDAASRFRWLTATRSTVVQTSKVHPGLCTDALETMNRLYKNLVG